jgi:dTDP-4-dehydrorhamnose 3,5-epimerase
VPPQQAKQTVAVSRFDFITTPLPGLKVVQRKKTEDSRGFLSRFYCAEEFAESGIDRPIAQINHTLTRKKGTVRGLHFQHPPYAEAKLISCMKGEILDIAVDIRKNSPSFLKWHAEVLSETNHRSLWIPEGFAHGFQTLTNHCELIYLHSTAYVKASEGAINPLDPMLAINWPLVITEISEKDKQQPMITLDFSGIEP